MEMDAHPIKKIFHKIFSQLGFIKKKIGSEEEVIQILEEGERSGEIDKTEHELIRSIFEFTDTTVKEVMVPRTDVFAVDILMPIEKIIQTIIDQGYTRVPVYKETIDNIIGIIYTKDLIGMLEHRSLILLQDILRPAYLVPESKKISHLLRELQKKRQHMAVVIDEFGGTEGIITMEDIIEEIVGEIRDEYDEEHTDEETTSDGATTISGGMSTHEFNQRFGVELPEVIEYDTIGGFLNNYAGRIPELNETITFKNISFTIVKKNDRRIRSVKVKIAPISNE